MKQLVGPISGVLAVAMLAVTLGAFTPALADTVPDPVITHDLPVTVIIPATTPAPTPTPTRSSTPAPSNSSGGNTPAPSAPPTNADGSPVVPAKPTDGVGKLTIDKGTATAGDWLTVTGEGYTPGEKVQFVLYPGAIVIGSFVADASGKVIARFKLPDDTRAGDHVVEATGWQSKLVKNVQLLVVTPAAEAPWLWWVLVVLGVLLAAAIALAIYNRAAIRAWFGGTPVPEGAQ